MLRIEQMEQGYYLLTMETETGMIFRKIFAEVDADVVSFEDLVPMENGLLIEVRD